MSVLDEINAEVGGRGGQCRVAAALHGLPDDIAAGYAQAINDPHGPTASAIARALRKREVEIRDNSIQRHRRDGCACVDALA